MCEHYGIDSSNFRSRLRKKWSLEKALTTPIKESKNGKKYYDHLGNEYSSLKSMCKAWNIQVHNYTGRMNNNWSLEATLTTPIY